MSGAARWEPFTLTADEWAEVAATLVAERGDESRFLVLHVAWARAEQELADFVNRYIRTTRG